MKSLLYSIYSNYKIYLLFLLSTVNSNYYAQSNFANYDHWILAPSTVDAMVEDPSYVYVSGNFVYTGPPTGNGAKFTTTSINPDLTYCRPNGVVRVVLPDGSGGWYIAGDFTSITTSSSTTVARNYLAHIMNTGQLDLAWNPNPNNSVLSIELLGTYLYAGGFFTSIGGQNIGRLAKIDATATGTADPTWNPNPNNAVYTILGSGTDLIVGGPFQTIGGISRSCLAKLSSIGTGTVDTFWNPNAAGAYVNDLVLSGNDLFIGGNFNTIGGQFRSNLAKISAIGTGTADPSWNPSPNGDVNKMAISGADFFIIGSFSSVGAQSRNGIAKLNAVGSVTVDPIWNPNPNFSVEAIATSSGKVYVGGVFSNIGGQAQKYIARINSTGTGSLDPTWLPKASSVVNDISISGNDIYVGGSFGSIGGRDRNNLVRFSKVTGILDTLWNPNPNNNAYALLVSGNSLFVGGSFTSIGGKLRNRLVKFSTLGSGNMDTIWNPNVTGVGASIQALEINGNELFVGGLFTTVGVSSRTNIAKINAIGTGTLYNWNPGTNQQVNSIVYSNSTLFVGGRFSNIGGASRVHLAALNPISASVYPSWNANISNTGNSEVLSMAISGNDLFVSGTFTNIGGQPRNNIAKLNFSGTADTQWNPNANNSVYVVKISGNDLYAGGTFTTIGGQTRNRIAKISALGTGSIDAVWNPNVSGNRVTALIPDSNGIYLGGNFSSVNGISPRHSLALLGENCVSPSIPSLSTSATSVCLNTTVSLSASGSLNSATDWQWFEGGCGTGALGTGTSMVVSPTITTTYFVSGLGGCYLSQPNCVSITIFVLPGPTVNVNNGSICLGGNFTINPTGAVNYSITGGNSIVSPTINTTYSVIGTGTNGCVNLIPALANITVNPLPTVTVNNGTICSGNAFTLVPGGCTTYTIQGGTNVVNPNNNSTYTVIGTSSLGCLSQNTATSNVTVNPSPTISVNNGTICSGNSFTILPSGATTYTYSSGSNILSPTVNSTVSVTGTSSLGCIGTNTALSAIVVNTTPTISVNSGSICSGNSFTMVPLGASTYTYSNGTNVVSPLTNTTISVTGTSSLGCVSSNTALSSISVNITPTISVNSGSICSGNSFVIVPTGANSYTVNGGNFTVSPTSNSNYSVNGTSSAGCVSQNTAICGVTVNANPTITVNSGSICSGNSYTISPSGASSYTISGGTFIVTPTTSLTYSVSGTSTAGCVVINNAISTVSVFARPSISVTNGSICSGNSFVISPTGATSYTISGGTFTVSPLVTSAYSVTGTSAFGCISSTPAISQVSVFSLPVISVNSGSICSGNTFTISPAGATTYSVSGGSLVVSPVNTSTYIITGTNNNGCVSSSPAISTVSVYTTPTITVNSGTICSGKAFTVQPSGASNYSISGGSFTVAPLVTSSYVVTGASSVGCIATNSAISNVTVYLTPTVSSTNGTICLGNSFSISPAGALNYSISGGSFVVSPTVSSSYSIYGLSGEGCVSSNTVVSNVMVNSLPALSVNGSTTLCSGESTTLIVTGADSYTWSTGSLTSSLVLTPANTSSYTVTGINSFSCTNTKSISISVDPCTQLMELDQKNGITLFPNPNNGWFNIDIGFNNNLELVVLNALGQKLKSQILHTGLNSFENMNFAKGIYYLHIFEGGNSTIRFKMLIE